MNDNPYASPTATGKEQLSRGASVDQLHTRAMLWISICALFMTMVLVLLMAFTCFLGCVAWSTHAVAKRNWLLVGTAMISTACWLNATYRIWRYRLIFKNTIDGAGKWNEFAAGHASLWSSFAALCAAIVCLPVGWLMILMIFSSLW